MSFSNRVAPGKKKCGDENSEESLQQLLLLRLLASPRIYTKCSSSNGSSSGGCCQLELVSASKREKNQDGAWCIVFRAGRGARARSTVHVGCVQKRRKGTRKEIIRNGEKGKEKERYIIASARAGPGGVRTCAHS